MLIADDDRLRRAFRPYLGYTREVDAGVMSEGSWTPIRVCLVEHDPTLRDLLSNVLSDAGFRLEAAVESLSAGRDAIVAHLPHVAVIGHHLPDGRGIDLCRSIAQAFPDVRLLLHAASMSPEEHREAFEAGATEVVFHSIHNRGLLDAVRIHGRAAADRKPAGESSDLDSSE